MSGVMSEEMMRGYGGTSRTRMVRRGRGWCVGTSKTRMVRASSNDVDPQEQKVLVPLILQVDAAGEHRWIESSGMWLCGPSIRVRGDDSKE